MRIRLGEVLLILMAVTLWVPCTAFGQSRHPTGQQARHNAAQTQRDPQRLPARFDRQRQEYRREISRLEASVKEEATKLREDKQRFATLWHKEKNLQEGFRPGGQDAEQVWEVYLAARSDAAALLKSSLTHAQKPLPLTSAANPREQEGRPWLDDIKQLVEALFAKMESSGKIVRQHGAFIGPRGTEVKGQILLLGDFNAFYLTKPGRPGFLRMDKMSGRLTGIPASSSWFDGNKEKIENYFTGKTAILPLDLSGGEIFTELGTGQDWLGWLRSGGLLVWPILLIGLAALLLILERLIFLLRIRTDTAKLMTSIQHLAAEDRWQECRQQCSVHAQAPVGRVLRAGLENRGSSREILENALQEAIMKELPRLESFLSTIGVLAAVAPLLGLLGTVSGMINTFHAITLHGTGDPRMLSGGISEALITTQLGLMVAIPVLILHHFLDRRVDSLIGELEEKSTAITVTILKNRRLPSGRADQAA